MNTAALRTALAEAIIASQRNGGSKQDRTTFANAISTSKISVARDSVAVAFRLPKGSEGVVAGPIWVEIVPAFAPSPRATVTWWPPNVPRRWKRADREADAEAHRELGAGASRFILRPTNYSYRFTTETSVERVREAGLDALFPPVADALAAIGKSGVLKAGLDSWLA